MDGKIELLLQIYLCVLTIEIIFTTIELETNENVSFCFKFSRLPRRIWILLLSTNCPELFKNEFSSVTFREFLMMEDFYDEFSFNNYSTKEVSRHKRMTWVGLSRRTIKKEIIWYTTNNLNIWTQSFPNILCARTHKHTYISSWNSILLEKKWKHEFYFEM